MDLIVLVIVICGLFEFLGGFGKGAATLLTTPIPISGLIVIGMLCAVIITALVIRFLKWREQFRKE